MTRHHHVIIDAAKNRSSCKLAKRSRLACDILLDGAVTRSCWTSCKCSLCLILIGAALAGELALGLITGAPRLFDQH